MNRWTIVIILLALACSSSAETTLKIMSFNVRYGTAMDGQNAWPKRKDILVNAIRQYAPDIIGVQECLTFQADYIVTQLSEYRWTGVDRDLSGKGEMTAVLYRHEVLYPLETGHFWLSETPDVPASVSWDSSMTRMATWLRFMHGESKQMFYFYNTHLDHRGAQAREKGIEVIAAHAALRNPSLPLILTGDFNASAQQSRPYEIAVENGFQDAWLKAEKQVGPPLTFTSFSAPEPDRDSRIDWIMYRGNIHVSHAETVLYNEQGRYPSDHLPVFAILHLANASKPEK